jgi:hypothetical protein
VVKEAHDLGMTVNVWTVDDLDVARQMRDLKVDLHHHRQARGDACLGGRVNLSTGRPRKGRTGLLLL